MQNPLTQQSVVPVLGSIALLLFALNVFTSGHQFFGEQGLFCSLHADRGPAHEVRVHFDHDGQGHYRLHRPNSSHADRAVEAALADAERRMNRELERAERELARAAREVERSQLRLERQADVRQEVDLGELRRELRRALREVQQVLRQLERRLGDSDLRDVRQRMERLRERTDRCERTARHLSEVTEREARVQVLIR